MLMYKDIQLPTEIKLKRMMGEPHFEFSDELLKRAARAVDTGVQLYESYSNTNELLNDFVSVLDGLPRDAVSRDNSRVMTTTSQMGVMRVPNVHTSPPLTTVEVNADRRDITLAITENPVMIALGLVANALEYVRKLSDTQLLTNVDLAFLESGSKNDSPVLLLKIRNNTSQRAIRMYSTKIKSSTHNSNDGMVMEFAGIQLRLNNDISIFVIAILAVIIIGCGYAYVISRKNGCKLIQ